MKNYATLEKFLTNLILLQVYTLFLSKKDNSYKNILPILSLLSKNDEKKLFEDLSKLDFNISKFKVDLNEPN